MSQMAAHEEIRAPIREAQKLLDKGLEGIAVDDVRKRMREVLQQLEKLTRKAELSGPVYEDVIQLKSIYSRYQNYLNWLERS
jgi:hypothetical protein